MIFLCKLASLLSGCSLEPSLEIDRLLLLQLGHELHQLLVLSFELLTGLDHMLKVIKI